MNIEPLKNAIELAKSAMPRSTPLPVLKTVRLKGDDQMLSILGSNLVCQIEADAGITLGGISRCIDPDKIMHALAGRDEADIKVTDTALMVKSGGGRFKIPFSQYAGVDYPTIDTEKDTFRHVEVDGLIDAIRQSAFATAASDVSRPYFERVCVRSVGGKLMVYACNAIFGSRFDLGESDENLFFCVPKEASLNAFSKAALHLSQNHMRLEFSDAAMTCKVTSAYGDVDGFFTEGDKQLCCHAKEMIEAVTRVTKFGSELMVGSRNLSVVKI
jgi:DNA polymerase III sliding clamp (beta) subunit (PCNA family)